MEKKMTRNKHLIVEIDAAELSQLLAKAKKIVKQNGSRVWLSTNRKKHLAIHKKSSAKHGRASVSKRFHFSPNVKKKMALDKPYVVIIEQEKFNSTQWIEILNPVSSSTNSRSQVDNWLSPNEVTVAVNNAVKHEIARKQKQGLPIARYDKESRKAYLENIDGTREYV
jgi:hypothetical protein